MNKLNHLTEKLRILVVDDEGFMRTVLSSIIKHLGCKNVIEARDGQEAWRQIEEHQKEHATEG